MCSGTAIARTKQFKVKQFFLTNAERISIPDRVYPSGKLFHWMMIWITIDPKRPFDLHNIEVMIPAEVLAQICSELEGMGEVLKIEIDSHSITFEGILSLTPSSVIWSDLLSSPLIICSIEWNCWSESISGNSGNIYNFNLFRNHIHLFKQIIAFCWYCLLASSVPAI